MSIQLQKFARRPFYVDAIQVTAENMADVAEWCAGTITGEGKQRHIKVRALRPINTRQTQAFVGDWVLDFNGFKVYSPSAFEKSFEKVHILTKEQAEQAGIHPPIEKPQEKKAIETQEKAAAPKPAPPKSGAMKQLEAQLNDGTGI